MEQLELRMLSDIDINVSYEGYLWMSDQSQPIVINTDQALKDFEYQISKSVIYTFNPEKEATSNYINPLSSKNPFIIEGNLYCKSNNESISIKYVYEKYILKKFKVIEASKQIYSPNRMAGISGLIFSQSWKPIEDAYCDLNENEKMQVLQPAEFIFIGFSN